MHLRRRLTLYPENVSDFTIAGELKYWEGLELLTAGHPGAGIYLLGYTAEMLLKVASFRFDGASPTDPVAPRLAPAKGWLKTRPLAVGHEAYHSLLFWANYLRSRRAAFGYAFDSRLEGELMHRVRRLYSIWWVEMRYRPDRATSHDVARAVDDVTWIRQNFSRLWRR